MKKVVVRPQSLAENIVVIDGFSCAGKSLVSPVLSSLERGELWGVNYIYEIMCDFVPLGKVGADAAEAIVRLYADVELYNLVVGRYVNFRPTDDTSVVRNLMAERYRARLRAPEGDAAVNAIRRSKPIFYMMTHYIFHKSELLFRSFGPRLKMYALSVRHPLWLIEHWYRAGWKRRFGTDPREFQLMLRYPDSTQAPSIVDSWRKKYQSLPAMDQSIHVVCEFMRSFEKRFERMRPEDKKKVMFIPLEAFSAEPERYLAQFEKRLKTRRTALTQKVFKHFDLPRTVEPNFLEKKKAEMYALFRKEKVSKESLRLLRRFSDFYEKSYMSNRRTA